MGKTPHHAWKCNSTTILRTSQSRKQRSDMYLHPYEMFYLLGKTKHLQPFCLSIGCEAVAFSVFILEKERKKKTQLLVLN